jgi:hypothetical protein
MLSLVIVGFTLFAVVILMAACFIDGGRREPSPDVGA